MDLQLPADICLPSAASAGIPSTGHVFRMHACCQAGAPHMKCVPCLLALSTSRVPCGSERAQAEELLQSFLAAGNVIWNVA